MKRGRGAGACAGSQEDGRALSLDLARLDRDLRGIALEERGSFGFELRAELAAEYARLRVAGSSRRSAAPTGLLAAAAVALVSACVWLVPPVRASLARLLRPVPEVEPAVGAPPPELSPPPVVIEGGESPPGNAPRPAIELGPPPPPLDDVLDGPHPPPPPTLPSLLDRDRARRTVTGEYPVALQERGLGGVVRVLLWVRPDGVPETPTLRVSSGQPELDEAALRATRSFRFLAATRAGRKVGAWVEFSIRFQPNVEQSRPDTAFQAAEIHRDGR